MGMAGHPGAQHRRHDAGERGGRGAQAQGAGWKLRVAGRRAQVAHVAQDMSGAFKNADAGRRGFDRAARPGDQGAAHVALQRAQSLLHGGGRQALVARGLGDGAQLHHMHIGLKKAGVHGACPS
ncbi:hypothetical protein D3C77_610440 [compost metagenome]